MQISNNMCLYLETLKNTETTLKEMNDDAHDALHRDSAAKGFKRMQLRRAEILRDLPNVLQEYINSLEGVEKEIVNDASRNIQYWADMASLFIETDNLFGMNTILIDRGSKIGDPDQLERLILLIRNKLGY